MHLVRQATTILVPTVRRYFAYQGVSMVVIDFIPGQTLADCWYSLITGVGFGSFTPSAVTSESYAVSKSLVHLVGINSQGISDVNPNFVTAPCSLNM